jgi:ribosomal protein S18 acetylase RimI-like enzyme
VSVETATARTYSRRTATAADDAFLRELYASTRADLEVVDWPDETRAAFCEMQWRAQRAGYASSYPGALDEVIEVNGRPAGRVLIGEMAGVLVLVDLALLPDVRGLGVGRQVIEDLQREAAVTGRGVRLQVAAGNPARGLYERLGFVASEQHGVHTEMTWLP